MNATLQLIRRNPWPYAIIGWFLIFGSGMAAWVVVAVRNDPDLVRADYYEQEIGYQKQIDRLNRTAALPKSASVTHDTADGQVVIHVPVESTTSGTIHFYRPSDAKLDQQFPLTVSRSGAQAFDLSGLAPGLWKVQVLWKANDTEFFCDKQIVIAGK